MRGWHLCVFVAQASLFVPASRLGFNPLPRHGAQLERAQAPHGAPPGRPLRPPLGGAGAAPAQWGGGRASWLLGALSFVAVLAVRARTFPHGRGGRGGAGRGGRVALSLAFDPSFGQLEAGAAGRRGGPREPATVEGSTWKVSLNVGREAGTTMPADWAASGARLALPLEVTFTDEPVRRGLFGNDLQRTDEAFNVVRRVKCDGGSFIGREGEVQVKVAGGAWSTVSNGRFGQRVLRFYLDFPEAVARNDASIAAGSRVFFATQLWDGEAVEERLAGKKAFDEAQRRFDELSSELQASAAERNRNPPPFFSADAPAYFIERVKTAKQDFDRASAARELVKALRYYKSALPKPGACVDWNGDVQIAKEATIFVKQNDIRNGFGFFADFFFLLGSFKMVPLPHSAAETPPTTTSRVAARPAPSAEAPDEPCGQGDQEPCPLPA